MLGTLARAFPASPKPILRFVPGPRAEVSRRALLTTLARLRFAEMLID